MIEHIANKKDHGLRWKQGQPMSNVMPIPVTDSSVVLWEGCGKSLLALGSLFPIPFYPSSIDHWMDISASVKPEVLEHMVNKNHWLRWKEGQPM